MRILTVLTLAAALLPAQERPAAPKGIVMTGCVDEEKGSRFVLLGFEELRNRAELRPDGFPNDAFAQYLGHTVRVSGSAVSEKPLVVKVRKIERLSEDCAPPPAAKQK